MAGAKVAVIPNRAKPSGRLAGGNSFSTRLNAMGMSTPPAKPCSARKMIMLVRSQAQAQATEKTRNRTALTTR